jgi:hypothetical protein
VVPAFIRRLVLPLAAVGATLVLPAAALADCPGASSAPAAPEGVGATLCLINAQRSAQGLKPLRPSRATWSTAGSSTTSRRAAAR